MDNPLALIIEDDVDLAQIFSAALKAANYHTETIHDGEAALERLARVVPALVVLDMHLPTIRGRIILERIRQDGRLKSTRVVIATADATVTSSHISDQADIVLIKPIRFNQLQHLGKRLHPHS